MRRAVVRDVTRGYLEQDPKSCRRHAAGFRAVKAVAGESRMIAERWTALNTCAANAGTFKSLR